jgi:hypothetical protein
VANTAFTNEIENISDPYERFLRLVKRHCKKYVKGIEKRFGGKGVDNYLRDYLRYRNGEEVSPEERFEELFSKESIYKAAKDLKIPEKERDKEPLELIPIIIDRLGLPSRFTNLSEGIMHFQTAASELRSRAEKSRLDPVIVKGVCVGIFQLLERIFYELLFVYATWRFSNHPSETFMSKWGSKIHASLCERLKKGTATLGSLQAVFREIDIVIQQRDDGEKKLFVKTFGREYLLVPLSERDRLTPQLPDIPHYGNLELTIQERNAIIHDTRGKSVSALETIGKVCEMIEHLRANQIFPDVGIQRCSTMYYDGTIRAGLRGEDGNIFWTSVEQPLEFGCEYYVLRTYPGATFIKRLINLEGVIK